MFQVGIDIGNQSEGYRLTLGLIGGCRQVFILVMRVTDIVLQWEDTRGMQVGIDIDNENDGYRLTVVGYTSDSGRY